MGVGHVCCDPGTDEGLRGVRELGEPGPGDFGAIVSSMLRVRLGTLAGLVIPATCFCVLADGGPMDGPSAVVLG